MTKTHVPSSKKITTAELAEILNVTPRCIQNWRDAGKIPFIRITARCIRYDLADVEAAILNSKSRF